MTDQVQVTIILAMIQFNHYEGARRLMHDLFPAEQVAKLKVVSLANLMSDAPGIEVTASEQFKSDFETLPAHRFEAAEGVTVRYIKDGEITAEVNEDVNQKPLLKTRFDKHQPVQSAVYEAGREFGILSYDDDNNLSQALLLNQQGQLVTRFIRHTQPVNIAYTMGRTSKLVFTEMVSETEKGHVKYQDSEVQAYYEVVSYQNYDRFDSVYSFYASVLEQVVAADSGLFIDLNDNPKLAPYLPQQLIFNY
ncbi:hypothetical protein [Secundilactobacillus silagei]|nr:hypothetical protein [Secundilactobacillus silagei]